MPNNEQHKHWHYRIQPLLVTVPERVGEVNRRANPLKTRFRSRGWVDRQRTAGDINTVEVRATSRSRVADQFPFENRGVGKGHTTGEGQKARAVTWGQATADGGSTTDDARTTQSTGGGNVNRTRRTRLVTVNQQRTSVDRRVTTVGVGTAESPSSGSSLGNSHISRSRRVYGEQVILDDTSDLVDASIVTTQGENAVGSRVGRDVSGMKNPPSPFRINAPVPVLLIVPPPLLAAAVPAPIWNKRLLASPAPT